MLKSVTNTLQLWPKNRELRKTGGYATRGKTNASTSLAFCHVTGLDEYVVHFHCESDFEASQSLLAWGETEHFSVSDFLVCTGGNRTQCIHHLKIRKNSGTVLLSTTLFQTLCQTVGCILNTLMVFSFFPLFRDNLVQEDFQDFQ